MEKYKEPEMEIVKTEAKDVLTESGIIVGPVGPGGCCDGNCDTIG